MAIPTLPPQAQQAGAGSDGLSGTQRLVADLLDGCGLCLAEALRVRVKDIDLETGLLAVRDGQGLQAGLALLPDSLLPALREQLRRVRRTHQRDLRGGYGAVELPFALERRYPAAAASWGWQYLFPSPARVRDASTGEVRRRPLSETALRAALHRAARGARAVE